MRALIEAESRQMRKSDDRTTVDNSSSSASECKVCMSEAVEVVLQPCKHAVLCYECSMTVKVCPICRAPVLDRMQIFM